jgi:hypothetical protein
MFSAANLIFRPGETVPHSGIYAVLHDQPHTDYHKVFIEGGTFPLCSVCTVHVTFRLILAVPHICVDEDFRSEPVAPRKSA